MRKQSYLLLALVLICSCAGANTGSSQQAQNFDWNRPFKPFRIIGNIYYVGTNDLACYLITTPSGHILLDTALEESGPIVKANIAELGFKLTDIKIMLSSHAHFDHVAGHANMKAATGAQVYASEQDTPVLESGGAKSFFPLGEYKPVKVDHRLKDNEVVKLGGVEMMAHITPGHTEGNTAWTTTVTENGKKYDVVFVSSMSINPGVHMVNFKPWPGIAEAYATSFKTLRGLHCDVFLGPHARFFNMEEKLAKLKTNPDLNPFIDPAGYKEFLDSLERSYLDQIKKESSEGFR